jgi:hypothetical protein
MLRTFNLRIRCSFKFILKVGVEESVVNCLNLTSLFALFVFLLCRLASGAFTIDFSTPTLRRNLNEHLTFLFYFFLFCSTSEL